SRATRRAPWPRRSRATTSASGTATTTPTSSCAASGWRRPAERSASGWSHITRARRQSACSPRSWPWRATARPRDFDRRANRPRGSLYRRRMNPSAPTATLLQMRSFQAKRGGRRPLIGVTTSEIRVPARVRPAAEGDPPQREMALGMVYLRAVEQAGGLPVVLPPLALDALEDLLDGLDGVCLSGGPDLDPVSY